MLIKEEGDVYFFDQDNFIFQIENLIFPHVRDTKRKLKDTLLDGLMKKCLIIFLIKNKKIMLFFLFRKW